MNLYRPDNIKNMPKVPGIYMMKDAQGKIIYIGKARNLYDRVRSYFSTNHLLEPKTKSMVMQIKTINIIETISEFDALLLEADLIKKRKPKYNVIWRDDKHPVYIKITQKEQYPHVYMVRREDPDGNLYFGPFPSTSLTKTVLRILRKIFPYCTQKQMGKPCFHTHIGLCNPCPSSIMKMSPPQSKIETLRYRRSLHYVAAVLSGKKQAVLHDLTSAMNKASMKENFEEAARIRDQIKALDHLTQLHFSSNQYIQNPNLTSDMFRRETDMLRELLSSWSKELGYPDFAPAACNRLECFDISNTSGKLAVGSMVVFIEGEPAKECYRHFRIKTKKSPDDPAMMLEVLRRRLKHTEWPYPDVLMVDGGKTQLSRTAIALFELKKQVCTIGLAKRREEIILPLPPGRYTTKRLTYDAPALHLLQRIRDEAHRFAITYHRKLRAKHAITS